MERLRDLLVKISAKGVGFNKTQRSMRGLTKGLTAVKAAAAGLAVGAFARVTAGLVNIGAAAIETESKFRTVFGSTASEVDAVATELGRLAGLSRSSARDILATTGAMAQGLGATQEASAQLSKQVLGLAGDFASFNNLPTVETARAVQSAFTGEFESLKRLGVGIKQEEVNRRALIETGKDHVRELNRLELAQAALNLINERAGVAVGDLERTQNSLANTIRRVQAGLVDLRELVGIQLVTAMGQLADSGIDTGSAFGGLAKVIYSVGTAARFTVALVQTLAVQSFVAAERIKAFFQSLAPGGVTREQATQNLRFIREGAEEELLAIARAYENAQAQTKQFLDGVLDGSFRNTQTTDQSSPAAGQAKALVEATSGINDTLETLSERLNLTNDLQALWGDRVQLNGRRVDAYRSALESLLEQGLKPTDSLVRSLQQEFTNLAVAMNVEVALRALNGGLEGTRQKAEELSSEATASMAIAANAGAEIGQVFGGSIDKLIGSLLELQSTAARVFASIGFSIARFALAFGIESIAPASGFLAAIASGVRGRAAGGTTFKGRPIVVGERGPEFFVPNTDGRIVPNSVGFGAGGGDLVNHITIVAADGSVVDRLTHRQRRNEKLGRVVLTSSRLGFVG